VFLRNVGTYNIDCHHMRSSNHTHVCLLKLRMEVEFFKSEKIDYSFKLNNAQLKEIYPM
jgi:hypothetical protein